MSQTSDQMELREQEITAHYPMALAMLQGFDHAPRIGKGTAAPAVERSSGMGTRRRFRSTTPGLVTRRTTPTGAVQLMATIEGADDDDALMSPVQA
ncbi:MAG: AAA family ATPase, partial [Pseudomonadota bacterium]